MYFKYNPHEGLRRLQGAFMASEEIMDTLTAMDFSGSNIKGKYDEVGFEIDASKEDSQSESAINAYASEGEEDGEEQLLVEIVEWIWKSKQENISNNQLKKNFMMGYDRANMFLGRLEEVGIVSKQRKGTKLGRRVNLDKVKDFLRGYDCVSDETKEDLPQLPVESDAGSMLEENMDATVESVDIQEAKEDNLVVITPQLERGRGFNLDTDDMKHFLDERSKNNHKYSHKH